MAESRIVISCVDCKRNIEDGKAFPRKRKGSRVFICSLCRDDHQERALKRHGLTRQTYTRLLDVQKNCCAICRKPPGIGSHDGLHIDHCHKTGQIRGLLCRWCNQALGHAGDDLESLLRFVNYLRRTTITLHGKPIKKIPTPTRLDYLRHYDASGQRVPEGTPGAVSRRRVSPTFFVRINRRKIDLGTADEQEANRLVVEMLNLASIEVAAVTRAVAQSGPLGA